MYRNALDAALADINRWTRLRPYQVQDSREMLQEIQRSQQLFERCQLEQRLQLGSTQLNLMQDMLASIAQIPERTSGIQIFFDALEGARTHIGLSSASYLGYARESFDAFLKSIAMPPASFISSPGWLDDEIDNLLDDDPKYQQSRLAWILAIFVPRLRLLLHDQDSEGDFDGVMQVFSEDLLNDPEVRSRLRERLNKSGMREELRYAFSSHLDKLESGEFMYAIIGLYAHIEGFLAELAVERGLIPDVESVLQPDGSKKARRGVSDLIRPLHSRGVINDSQEKFLTFVLSNSYQANRLRHGTSYEFTQERATALVLGLIMVLCLSWGMPPDELLDEDSIDDKS